MAWKPSRSNINKIVNIVEYVQECIAVYEKTLKAMGLTPLPVVSQTTGVEETLYSIMEDVQKYEQENA